MEEAIQILNESMDTNGIYNNPPIIDNTIVVEKRKKSEIRNNIIMWLTKNHAEIIEKKDPNKIIARQRIMHFNRFGGGEFYDDIRDKVFDITLFNFGGNIRINTKIIPYVKENIIIDPDARKIEWSKILLDMYDHLGLTIKSSDLQDIFPFEILLEQQKKHIRSVKSIVMFVLLPLFLLDLFVYTKRLIGYNTLWFILISLSIGITALLALDGIINYYKIQKTIKSID